MYDGLKNLDVPRRARKRHPRARRVLRLGMTGLIVLLIAVLGTGLWLYSYVNDKLGEAVDHGIIVDELLPDEAMNVLILGSDRRDVLSAKERRKRQFKGSGGHLTDTILLLHVSPKANKAVLLSFPRDLRVEIPGCGVQKINSAISCDGPNNNNLVLRTVKKLTGIKIHHFVSINYVGFRDIVEAAGGVEVCVKQAYNDPKAGLRIPKPGCYDMDGNMALAWVRTRSIDPRADIGRVERQQQFIRALMRKVNSIKSPLRLTEIANKLPRGVTISHKLDLGVARSVAAKLSLSKRAVDFRIVPNYPRYIGGVSYLLVDDPEASRLFRAISDDSRLPPYGKTAASLPTPEDVTVKLLNGTSVAGLAGRQKVRLENVGFDVISTGDASSRFERTVIQYVKGEGDLKVGLIKAEYPNAEVKAVTRDLPADVVVTLGADVAAREASASPSPSPG